MHNPNGITILEHAIEIAALSRPLVAAVQRRDRDLASQVRRAVSSIALNVAESQGNGGGNTRVRLETALGSLYEAQAALRLAMAWGYFSQVAANEVLGSMHGPSTTPRRRRLGGRVYGLVRK
jgi:four helix bundle protein